MNFYVNDTEQVDKFATDNGHTEWFSLSQEGRQKMLSFASSDIEELHGRKRKSYNLPWMYGDVWLTEACLYQIIFLTRNKGMREWVERAQFGSNDQFGDSIISVSRPGGVKYDKAAKNLVESFMARMGISVENYEVPRG